MKKYITHLLLLVFVCVYKSDASADPNMNIFNGSIVAYHTYLMEMIPLGIQSVNNGTTLPDALVIPPGKYNVYGQTYDMAQEGLYRFLRYSDLTTVQRIVYDSDSIALISSMQWIFTQSYIDNSKTNVQLAAIAKADKLRISCGKAVDFMAWLMPQHGYQARYAGAITQQEWNYVNDGHAMVEIYLDGKWVLFDPAFNTRFWRDGEPLSLPEVAEDLGTVDVEYMAFDTGYDVSGLWYQGHSLGSLFEPMMDSVLLKKYYERMMDSLIVQDGSTYYYYDAGAYDSQFQSWGYVKLTKAEWLSLFYP